MRIPLTQRVSALVWKGFEVSAASNADARELALRLLDLGERPFALLVENNPTAFVLGEIAFDSGTPHDARLIYVNPAYELQTPVFGDELLGAWTRSVGYHLDPGWLAARAAVLTTGSPHAVTQYQRESRRWVELYVFAVTDTVYGEYLRDVTDLSSRGDTASFDGLTIDYAGREVFRHGQPVDLTRSEFDILARLSRTPGVVVPTDDLLSARDHSGWSASEASIGIHVSRLRAKLGESAQSPRYIATARGVGYRFSP